MLWSAWAESPSPPQGSNNDRNVTSGNLGENREVLFLGILKGWGTSMVSVEGRLPFGPCCFVAGFGRAYA